MWVYISLVLLQLPMNLLSWLQLKKKKIKKKEKERKNLWESFCVYITKLLGLYTDNLKPAKHMCTDGKI